MLLRTPAFFYSADDSLAGGGDKSDDKSRSDGAPDGNDKELASMRAEIDKLQEERDSAKRRERLANDKLREIEGKQNSKDRKDAEEKGDVAKLRESFENEKKTLEAHANALTSELNDSAKYSEFLRHADLFVKESVDNVWKLIRDDLDIEIEDGKRKVVVKDSAVSVAEYFKRFAEKNEYLAKNQARSGAGADDPARGNGKAGISTDQFSRMSESEKRQAMLDDPGLVAKVLRSGLSI